MKKLYTFLVLLFFLPLSTMAQVHYPIRTNTIVTPPVPFSLDGFVSQPGKLMLNVLVDDVTLSQYPVKLQLHIEGNGIRITSNPNIAQQPIYLDGGVTTQLTGSDLEFYFNPENLLFQGYSLSEYRRNGRLPEGVYRIRFEVLDFYRDFKISSAIPAVAMMSLTNGPVLTFPANRSEVDVDANPVLRFSWMAVFTAIPDALIEYRFKLWQIRPDNRDPFEITKVTTPVYEVDLSETALLYDGSLPPLEKGARYVWQVTALDLSGNVLFKKDGNSDIATFRYGYECAAPSAVISRVSHNSVSVSWNSNSSIREYIVSYRKENDSEWQEVTTSNVGLTIDNLEHSVQYELYVRASCGDASSSNERLLRFKTDRFVDYSCGAGAPRISFENQDPLPALHRFDEFKAADFYIEVTEVSGSQGVFSGRGLASIPFLEFLKFEVSFNDITINTDRQMIDGHVVFLHEEETGKIPGRNMGVGGSQGAEGSQELSFEEALNEIADQKVTIDEEVADVSVSNGNVTVVTESGQTQSYLVGENQTLAIVTPESIVVVDQASGQVFQAPNTPPGSSSNVRTPSQSGIHGCLVTFRPSATQRLGFDAVGNGVVKPNSYFLRDRNGDAVPWKSLEAGNTDYVAMLTNGDCQADSLRFIRESGLLTPTTPGRNNSLELLLTGGFQGQEERLTVARATTNHINDSTSEEILTEAGVLGLVSYQRITRDVFLIPVNGASFPTASTQLSDIEKRLNEIYGSAVINWNVHFDEPIEVGRINEAEFKVEGTAMLSKYTSDMNRVIRTYKRNRPSDDNSLYLFFVELSDLGTSRKGFMPLAGNFGFIFNFSASDFDLLAHELAHGAFNLRHTFSDKAQHYFPVQQTANLMDYAGGTDLWKYQWDLIHDPESILFAWGQDEEEGAYTWTPVDKQHALLFNHVYDNNHIGSMNYLKAIEDAIAKGNDDTLSLAYTDDEAGKWTKEQKQWIDDWKIRAMNSDEVFTDIIKSIKETDKDEKIEKIVLRPKHIYIGKYKYEDVEYPVAIYGNGDKTVMTKAFTKIQVTDAKELEDKEKKEHIYCDETYTKYLIIAFYEDEKDAPSMIMQVEKFDISQMQNTKEKWLEYLGILGEPVKYEITQEQLEEIFPNTDTTRLKEVMEAINDNCGDFNINTTQRMSHFLGQIGTETGGMKALNENECYSEASIKSVFGKVKRNGNRKYCDLFEGYNGTSLSTCPGNTLCECNPVLPDSISLDSLTVKDKYICKSALFDYTYACRMGNGAPSTKDGSKFKGKGFIQLTGKDKYKQISDEWNKMYPDDPKEFHGKDIDLLTTNIEIAIKASMVCWKIQGLNSYSDIGMTDAAIDQVGSIVNGSGTARPNGADHRIEYTNRAHEVLNKNE